MKINDIRHLYSVNTWATDQLLAVLKQFSQEEYDVIVSGNQNSIRGRLAQHLKVNKDLFSWFDGSLTLMEFNRLPLRADDVPTVEAAEKLWKEIAAQIQACIDNLSEEKLSEIWDASNGKQTWALPLGELMYLVAIYLLQTRSQVVYAIRCARHDPESFKYTQYAMLV